MIKWIGQHIWDFISRFRNDVYLESVADGTVHEDKFLGLDSTGKIVKEAVSSGTTYTAGTGLDLGGTEFSVDVSDFMTNGSDNRVVTATGADAMNAEANLTFTGGTLSIEADLNSTADALFIDCDNLESGSAIEIDIDHGTTTALNSAVSTNIINIDYDKSADHTSGNRYAVSYTHLRAHET